MNHEIAYHEVHSYAVLNLDHHAVAVVFQRSRRKMNFVDDATLPLQPLVNVLSLRLFESF